MAIICVCLLPCIGSNVYSEDVEVPFWWRSHDSSIKQLQDKSKLRNTCGAMCSLIAYNYFSGGDSGISGSRANVVSAIDRLYQFSGRQLNEYMWIYDIRSIMKDRWGWSDFSKVRGSGYDFNDLKDDLRSGRPVITLMKGSSSFAPSGPGSPTVNHFITVMGVYESIDSIVYIDPWDGQIKWSTIADFRSGWVGSRVAVTGKPNDISDIVIFSGLYPSYFGDPNGPQQWHYYDGWVVQLFNTNKRIAYNLDYGYLFYYTGSSWYYFEL